MSYVIVINLNYDTQPADVCAEIWALIKAKMLSAGFRIDSRRFNINLPEEEACKFARKVIEDIEKNHLDYHHEKLHLYLRDFYGYDMAKTTNLLLPELTKISVEDKA